MVDERPIYEIPVVDGEAPSFDEILRTQGVDSGSDAAAPTRGERFRSRRELAAEREAQATFGVPLDGANTPGGPTALNMPASAPTEPPAVSVAPPMSATEPATTPYPVSRAGTPSYGLVSAPVETRNFTLDEALREVVRLGASDLHLTADAPPMLRINGGLQPIEGARPWSVPTITRELRQILNERQSALFNDTLELDFAHPLDESSRFRVNYYQQRGLIGAAFRLIPTEIKSLRDLGVPESVERFSTLPRGLVLVTGPTGSGKSTTLAGLIDLVNKQRADHIVTVEDPIEFMHRNQKSIVNQREVGEDTHSFANALKHVLRQDPDVILIGEMRDLETISVALTAAETGHLVFATLHTQDAAQTIDRVIDVFPPHQQGQVRTQLAATLQGVVCQTLVPRASGKGRAVATEVLVMTPALSNLIREGKTHQILSSMQAGKDLGMHTMDQHLAQLVNAGTITVKDAEKKAHDQAGFRSLLYGAPSPTEDKARALQASGPSFGDSYSERRR
ncbi:twitching motility protein PilT [Paramicrobacterium humi]|uniref:Twitching motility protein PilT n=1 Tax=Paramicrobacterium humi TaxID=640635 RepID=A0A1H4J5I5_9MICO|nr:PilT/PilU family type 4a pilus ATPase [Microbacterium humi]SEB40908.1 twitching motility protein PilT [Microbacterium humi]